jgi:hypothetical protein
MYFDFLKDIKYLFGKTAGQPRTVKDMFSRPNIETNGADRLRIDNGLRPDQYSDQMYGSTNLFYVNLLLNNHTSKNDWPLNEMHLTEQLNDSYGGFSIHVLESTSEFKRGDVLALVSDLDSVDPDAGEIPSYAIINSWDPFLRKIHVQDYFFGDGTDSPTTASDFFKEGNIFRVFHRDQDGKVETDGAVVNNKAQFPGLTLNNFTMRNISNFIDSLEEFHYTVNGTQILNPYMENVDIHGISFNSLVAEYDAGNTRGTCSLLDAYILQPSGDTGPDGGTFGFTSNIKIRDLRTKLIDENEEKRYINTARSSIVGSVVEKIRKDFNK